MLTVDVVSDVVCPWCFIGKRRLEAAAGQVAMPLAIRWIPFQLDGTIPPGGKPRREYLQAKFGSADRVRGVLANVETAGASEGIPFAFDRIAVSPNTLDAHRLIRWAGEAGQQSFVVEALFRAYFTEGRDIGDHAVLVEIAAAAGLDGNSIAARLATDADQEPILDEIENSQRIGVTGVPTFIVAGRYALVGAQPAAEIAAALNKIAARTTAEPVTLSA